MSFSLVIIFAGVFASWAVLSLVGGERQRRLDVLEAERTAEAQAAVPTSSATKGHSAAPAARQSTR